MLKVMWEKGSEPGFFSHAEAARFIEQVCKKTAPDLHYTIIEDFSEA